MQINQSPKKSSLAISETSQTPIKIPTDVLDNLTLRFILNNEEFLHLDPEEYYFIIEQAYWYALDFLKIKYLPLVTFAEQLFAHNEISIDAQSDYLIFKRYKQSIKVFGSIIFSKDLSHVLLVRQFNGNITFPKGKKAKNENGMDCAIRETLEEVGYDVSSKISDLSVNVFDKITFYCVFNVDIDFPFKTNTRNEICEIFWFDLKKFNDIKDKKEYKIFYTAYRAIQSKIQEIIKSWFRFDMKKISSEIDKILNKL